MYYLTYTVEGFPQHLRTSPDECGSDLYCEVTEEQASILCLEGEFQKWRVDPSLPELYRLPDCDPKYWKDASGRIVEMDVEEQAGIDARQLSQEMIATERVRAERNARLSLCDWTQLPDSPLTPEVVEAWKTYRRALRDVPEQQGFPSNVAWPVSP